MKNIEQLLTQDDMTYYDIFHLKIIDDLLEKYKMNDRDNIITNISKRLTKYMSYIHDETVEINDTNIINQNIIWNRLSIMVYLIFNKIYYSNSKEQYNYIQKDNDEFDDLAVYEDYYYDVQRQVYIMNEPIIRYSESMSSNAIEMVYKMRRFGHIRKYIEWIVKALQLTGDEIVCVSILLCRLYEIDNDIISTFLKEYVDMLIPMMIMIIRKMHTREHSMTNGYYSKLLHFELDKLNKLEIVILMCIKIYISQDEFEKYSLMI